jgi:hypothetical protein
MEGIRIFAWRAAVLDTFHGLTDALDAFLDMFLLGCGEAETNMVLSTSIAVKWFANYKRNSFLCSLA